MKNKFLLMLLCLVTTSVYASKTLKYDWLTMGKKTGEQIVIYQDNNQVDIKFHFTDRGRGPEIHQQAWFDKNALPKKLLINGKSYMGAKVDEKFSIQNNIASWKNTQESQNIPFHNNAYYIAADGSPQDLEFLVKAIDKAKNNTLKLLPSGQATYSKLITTEVKKGDITKKVTLYAITGLGFNPEYAWFDQDKSLFALAYGWMGMTPEGWADSLDHLHKLQKKSEHEYHKNLAKQHVIDLAGVTRFTNVNLYTATNKGMLKNTDIAIKNGKILALGKKATELKAAQVIDGKGMTLMPGLWDMHTHISLDNGILNIANGITSVRDLANKHEDLMQATNLFEQGTVIGPHIYRAGFIDQKSPYSAPTGKLAESLDDALEYINWYADRDYKQIKIYSSITPSWVKPIADLIHQKGMKLSGHIPSFMTTEQAIKDGFDEIQHINMVFLNFLAGKNDDTRTPLRFTLVGDKAAELDLNSKEVNDFIALLKEKDTIIDPTVTIFHSMYINKAGEIDPGYQAIVDHLPANVARGFLSSELEINASNEKQYAASAKALLAMIKKLHDAGIRLVAGTDAISGFTLHRELELYAEAGISNDDVLKIATVNSARIAGQNNTGTIEVGQVADLILIDGNPLKNISAIRKVAYVVKGEQAFKPANMFSSIGIKPFVAF